MFHTRRPTVERSVPLALIAFALFLRVLVPAGWMPAEEGFGLRPCISIAAAAPHQADASPHDHAAAHHEAPRQDEEQQTKPCSFTAFGSPLAFVPPADEAPPVVTLTRVQPTSRPTAVRLPRRLAAPPPPPTGPPAFV